MSKKDILNKIKSLEGLSQDERAYLVNLVNTKKKYGLVWEDKPEDVEEQLRTKLPVLQEVKERAIINDAVTLRAVEGSNQEPKTNPNHILIEGDNLHALTALTFTHENKIDLIYIDPPYNTGNKDFIYNDHYVDKEDAYRHSKWLAFINRRLNVAHRLLSDDGVIFISIGSDELAQLTLLCNELFGEDNNLGIVSRYQKKGSDKGNYFSPSIDYILAYAKNKSNVSSFSKPIDDSKFKLIETEGERKGEIYEASKSLYQSSLDSRPNQRYYVECPDGQLVIPPGNIYPEVKKDGSFVKPLNNEDKCWRWSYDSYLKQKDLLVFKKTKKTPLVDEKGNQAKWNLYTKRYLKDAQAKGNVPPNVIDNCFNTLGTNRLKDYDLKFSFSKPKELIQYLVNITGKKDDITILDFFAGSGTTMDAVIELNNLDNATRKAIIVTNNEGEICDTVTYPRVKRIIEGYTNEKGKEMPSFPNNNLFMYKTAFVDREPSLQNKRQLTQLATELLCIKEDCYIEVTSTIGDEAWHKLFTNNQGQYVYVIYDDMYIEEAVETLTAFVTKQAPESKIKVYVFANGQYAYHEEFEEIAVSITLAALPDAIYKAYQNVLPKENKEFVPELEEEGVATEPKLDLQ